MKGKLKKFLKNFFKIVQTPEMKVLPGQLAFFFVLSFIPIVALLGAIMPVVGLTVTNIESFFGSFIPKDIASFLAITLSEDVLTKSNFIVFFISAFVLASNGTSSMIITSNSIYKIKGNGFFERRIKALIMMIILMGLLAFIVLVPVFGDLIIKLFSSILNNAELANRIRIIYNIIKIPLSLFLIFFNVKLLYTLAPDTNIKSKDTTFGALFTAICWFFSTKVFSFYISNFAHYELFYGSISSLLVLLLWVYLLAYIFVLGMAFNAGETLYNNSVNKIE